jgi:hypothetical protein
MNYELSEHAKDVLDEREIPLAWLEQALDLPEKTEIDLLDDELEHRLCRINEYENRVLRVILNTTTKPPRVVTVYFDRAMRDKL